MKIYLACFPHEDQQATLTEFGYQYRLISFAFIMGTREGLIADIVRTGLADYVEKPDEPIDGTPIDVQLILGGDYHGK